MGRALLHGVCAAGLLLLGAAVGVAATAVHALDWGLPLAIAATLVPVYALPRGWWTRLAFALGWASMVAWLTTPRAEGDYVISADWRGYTLLAAAVAITVAGIVTASRPRRVQPGADTPAS
ncbi:DUF6113 family protein [Nocardioides ferulae]|uniref:DUF6113 family protein n=1 Tax=Nocardioides ferulae TaxID=2340821 RepID=UPI000EB4CE96|nr:DUF6113 family protein [Nocardioides ferulae]